MSTLINVALLSFRYVSSYPGPYIGAGLISFMYVVEVLAVITLTMLTKAVREVFSNTNLPTPWGRVLLEKLTGSRLVKKFPPPVPLLSCVFAY